MGPVILLWSRLRIGTSGIKECPRDSKGATGHTDKKLVSIGTGPKAHPDCRTDADLGTSDDPKVTPGSYLTRRGKTTPTWILSNPRGSVITTWEPAPMGQTTDWIHLKPSKVVGPVSKKSGESAVVVLNETHSSLVPGEASTPRPGIDLMMGSAAKIKKALKDVPASRVPSMPVLAST